MNQEFYDRAGRVAHVIGQAQAAPIQCQHKNYVRVRSSGSDECSCLDCNELFTPQAEPNDPNRILHMDDNLLNWAVAKWQGEVKNRPLQNVHRRTLDDAWRQVIRFAGGDPVLLVGPCHDDLLAETNKP